MVVMHYVVVAFSLTTVSGVMRQIPIPVLHTICGNKIIILDR